MGTALYIDQGIPTDLTRLLHIVKNSLGDEIGESEKGQLEERLAGMSEHELASIDERSRFERYGELYCLGNFAGKHYPADATSVEDFTARTKRKFRPHVPEWFLRELDPGVALCTLGEDYKIDTVRDLLDEGGSVYIQFEDEEEIERQALLPLEEEPTEEREDQALYRRVASSFNRFDIGAMTVGAGGAIATLGGLVGDKPSVLNWGLGALFVAGAYFLGATNPRVRYEKVPDSELKESTEDTGA